MLWPILHTRSCIVSIHTVISVYFSIRMTHTAFKNKTDLDTLTMKLYMVPGMGK